MKKKKLWITLAVIAAVVAVLLYAGRYHKGPWCGKVVDAETGQPIEGAAVVAVWTAFFSLNPAGGHSYLVYVEETVTDKDGGFKFDQKSFLNIPMIKDMMEPDLTIFKPGYGAFRRYSFSPSPYRPDEFLETNGALVSLSRLSLNTREERLKYLPNTPPLIWGNENRIKHFNQLLNEEIQSINAIDNK